MDSAHQNIWKMISGVLFCVIIANLVYLNVLSFQTKQTRTMQLAVTPTIGPSQLLLTGTPTPILTAIPTTAISPTKPPIIVSSPTVKEYFIPFGSGTGNSGDWQDVPGLQATIDTANYPNIKSILFEISLRNSAGGQEMHARLYNATDKQPVWTSEVFYKGNNTGELLISSPIVLAPSSKTYTVQLKTQLLAPVSVDQSRLHITLK